MLNDQQQSQDESGYGKPKAQKKRRFRACDMCRRRKGRIHHLADPVTKILTTPTHSAM
ncbi:hypothetical protein PHLCEN_2v11608 [Hermanssonia centrifuga]|uniref:Uncharacterized protein n=1 Tax=Hermanssonia centrifuga TaxID=98765 RepID=A0A2R6NJU3_9APHY|nr:hypothetical protein PHLCEN_2v11608 [Hermanssonia centrifuga]